MLRHRKTIAYVAILFVTLFLYSLEAGASMILLNSSTNEAVLDWNSFSYQGGLTPYDYLSWSRAVSIGDWDLPQNPPYNQQKVSAIADTHAFMQTGTHPDFSSGEAETNSDNLLASASAATTPGSDHSYSAAARAQRSIGFYKGAAAGSVNFSINYSLAQNLFTADGHAYGFVRAWCWLKIWDPELGSWRLVDDTFKQHSLDKLLDPGDSFYLSPITGTLSINFSAPANSFLLFETGVDAVAASSAPVPIPSTLLLLCSGVAGLLIVRKKA